MILECVNYDFLENHLKIYDMTVFTVESTYLVTLLSLSLSLHY